MHALADEITQAGRQPQEYPLLPFLLDARRDCEPTLSQVATELQLCEAIARTAYAARIKRGAMTPEAAWHRLQCLAVARRIVEERQRVTGEP